MVSGNRTRTVAATAGIAALALLAMGVLSPLAAQTTSAVATGGYLHFPKIVVHTTSGMANPLLLPSEFAKDTVVQITNVSNQLVEANCYYVNANGHCGGADQGPASVVCTDDSDCLPGVRCVPGWQSNDFTIQLTPLQPIGWVASQGTVSSCFPTPCAQGSTNFLVPAVPEEPFIGELRCVQVDPADNLPVLANDLKGEATIVEAGLPSDAPTEVLSAAYNALSFVAVTEGTGTDVCLGEVLPAADCGAEYSPCASSLMLQHYFDGATTPNGIVNTELTLSPCSAEMEIGDVVIPESRVVAQIFVYNEFEQRFSTGEVVSCVKTQPLVDLDTPDGPLGDAGSIFSVGVQGTLGGFTRIQGTADEGSDFGPGLVALAHQYFSDGGAPNFVSSSAYHVNGIYPAEGMADAVYLPVPPPVGP